jgi:hypothetical protein
MYLYVCNIVYAMYRVLQSAILSYVCITSYVVDHSLPVCLPACRYQLTSHAISTAGLEKRWRRLFGQTLFQHSSESLYQVTITT